MTDETHSGKIATLAFPSIALLSFLVMGLCFAFLKYVRYETVQANVPLVLQLIGQFVLQGSILLCLASVIGSFAIWVTKADRPRSQRLLWLLFAGWAVPIAAVLGAIGMVIYELAHSDFH